VRPYPVRWSTGRRELKSEGDLPMKNK